MHRAHALALERRLDGLFALGNDLRNVDASHFQIR